MSLCLFILVQDIFSVAARVNYLFLFLKRAHSCIGMQTCLITSNVMLKTLKFSGSAYIDFLSVIQARNVNNAKHAGLVIAKFFHVVLLLEFLPGKGWLSALIGRNEVSEGRYLQIS
jgi:hypothetical protein